MLVQECEILLLIGLILYSPYLPAVSSIVFPCFLLEKSFSSTYNEPKSAIPIY
jgi:hypothetical protein